ncbi:hypothetical protein [Klebsiella pneumoniae]|uniref:hypothetical protein n=1 Tax=Klebsiella pneumoniae TaxID=573 RepID=UPI0021A88F67|nr:hypothetical protein [Klebsiella pneumoniae]
MTKSTITRERLLEIIETDHVQCGEASYLARMALAAMDSDPVAEVVSIYGDPESFGEREIRPLVGIQQMPYGTKLYRHAQQPVVADDLSIFEAAIEECKTCDSIDEHAWNHGVLAVMAKYESCRAAILQAEPVTAANKLGKSPVIPDGLPDGVNIYHWPKEKTILVLRQDAEAIPDCWCRTCRPVVLNDMRFVVCPDCGNKRCPRASDHRNACTGSNEPGQEGSAYPVAPQEVKGE